MKGRLVGLIVPAAVASAALGATAAGYSRGAISQGVWLWLWPSLVALLWLALGIGALFMRWTKWAWPPLAACLVQLIGLLLLYARAIHDPIEVFWYSLGTLVVGLLIILAVWLIVTLRTRALEKRLMEGGGEGVDAQALARIRKDMADALAMLRRAGTGRNAIYELPWLLVMGRPQGGKTFAIKNSGLSLPIRKDWVKGAGGTFTADWFFTNEMIFLDTPGKWVQEGVSEEGSKNWIELLRLLRRHRGRRPLDGLVVVVPADDLLSKSAEELEEQAAHIREVIDLIHDELKFRFPVYLLVSKTDLVEGFVDFFKGLPANRKHQIFGWSHPDPNDREAVTSIRSAFGRVLRRMQAIRLEILARTASASAVRRLFFFTEEFRRLEDPLVEFAEALFQSDPFHETPVFRGFYFTSATQGDGTPLGQAMGQLARNLGVRSAPPTPGETEAKRSYFLLEMFRTLMVGDEGLVSRTAGHWLRRRRDTVLAAFLPAVLSVVILLLGFISYAWNRSIYRDAAEEIPKIVEKLESEGNVTTDAFAALEDIDRIRDFHYKMTGFTLLRSLGMRQPGKLADETFRIFRDELQLRVLRPSFQRAEQLALESKGDFVTQADLFYSVVWLRQGNVAEYGDDLKGFATIWSMSPEDAGKARELLVEQFEHLIRHLPNTKNLLADFDLARVAEALERDTAAVGSASALRRYVTFQDECSSPPTPNAIRRCHEMLRGILNFSAKDSRRLDSNLRRLKNDLREIQNDEDGAKPALEILKDIRPPERDAGECFAAFESEIIPRLKSYYLDQQESRIENCRSQAAQRGGKGHIAGILNEQDKELEKEATGIQERAKAFNDRCAESLFQTGTVNVVPVFTLSRSYRRVQCADEPNLLPQEVKKIIPPPAGLASGIRTPIRGGPKARPDAGPSLEYFTRGGVPPGYNQNALEQKKTEQGQEIQYAETLPTGEKATKDAEIRRTMDQFAVAYSRGWEQYLRSIRLKNDPPPDPGTWLQGLSQTTEWRTVLEPASDALGVAGNAADPHFGGVYQKLSAFSGVQKFLNADLGMYTGLLKQVGQDLAKCKNNPAMAGQFRSELSAGAPTNSLVKAQAWVDQNGGLSLAQGALRDLLNRPLEIAKDAVGASANPNKRWGELVSASQRLSQRFPFSGSETDELATPEEVKAVFGGLSGIVQTLYAEKDKLQLSSESAAWLERAHNLSSVFFDPNSDALKTYTLKLTLNDTGATVEPPKAAKDNEWRLQKFDFQLMSEAFFSWAADKEQPPTKTIKLDLFGENAAGLSKITLGVGHRERNAKLKIIWVDVDPPTVAVSADGSWSVLRVLAEKKPAGGSVNQVTVPLTAAFPFKDKKNPDGRLTVKLDAEGRQLGSMLDMIKDGFPPAPATP